MGTSRRRPGRQNRSVETSQSELAFADTVPATLAEAETGNWFTGVWSGGAPPVESAASIHELDTSTRLPVRERLSKGYGDALDPYGRRGCDRRFAVVTTASATRHRWVVWSMATAAALLGLASLLVG
jgi:hypothetical protein